MADLQIDIEPEYPLEALVPGEQGEAAEDKWWAEVLLWGRDHQARLQRICAWAVDLGMEVPDDYCEPS